MCCITLSFPLTSTHFWRSLEVRSGRVRSGLLKSLWALHFYRPDTLLVTQPAMSKHLRLNAITYQYHQYNYYCTRFQVILIWGLFAESNGKDN